MKAFSQNSQLPGRDFNPGAPKYETGVLTTRPQCLFIKIKEDNKQYLTANELY
jgi:hypothetical protein